VRGPALFCLLALALAIAGCKEGDEGGSGGSPGDSWATLAPLNEPRQEVGVAALGNRIYVAGGFRADRSTANTVEAYDVAANTWGFVAPMPQGLNHPAAAVVGSRLYVMGGFLGSGPAVASTSTSLAPTTHVFPMPRATMAAWLVIPPRAVSTARAATIP